MAANKTGTITLPNGTSVAVSTSFSSTASNLTAADSCTMTCQITNGATAPTVGCTVTLQISIDATSTDYMFYQSQAAGIAASTTYSFSFDVPPAVLYARLTFYNGASGAAVTAGAQAHVLNNY